jgi:ribokinase
MTGATIVVVGSLNLDLAVRVPHLPRPGETLLGDDFERRPGGKGANQAVAAARLGARARLVGLVGSDLFGADLHGHLAAERVDVDNVGRTEEAPTGVAMIVVAPDGENMITLAPGANDRLGPQELAALPGLLEDADALLLQLEVPVPAALAAARMARAANVAVVVNAAPLPAPVSQDLLDLIALADVLVVNETETAGLTGIDAVSDYEAAARALLALGPDAAVITLGRRGAVAADGTGVNKVPAFRVEAVDAVGAGDAFCAELAIARDGGALDLATATRRACAAGALAATRIGTQSALPRRAEVDRLLDEHGEAVLDAA